MCEKKRETIKIELEVIIITILFLMWIGYYAGWGRWVAQSIDWNKHNAILCDLVNKKWPVCYRNGDEHAMLVYYIAQYLLPAAFGKLTHSIRCAEIAHYIWAEIGLVLVYFNMLAVLKIESYKMKYAISVIMAFFSVPLWISELFMKRFLDINTVGSGQWFYYNEGILLQYSNNFVLLRWVFPQVIAIWLTLLLFMEYREKVEYYILIMLPAMLFGVLSFAGIIPIAVVAAFDGVKRSKTWKTILENIFSMENISVFVSLGSILGLYYYGNVFGFKPDGMRFQPQPFGGRIGIYFGFVLINVVVYGICLWSDNKHDSVFYVSVISLLLLPFFKMGQYNDWGMRVSIPALFFYMVYVITHLEKHLTERDETRWQQLKTVLIVVFLVSGMFYSFGEFSSCVQGEVYSELGNEIEWPTIEDSANRNAFVGEDMKYNYFAYDLDDNLFYKMIAKINEE